MPDVVSVLSIFQNFLKCFYKYITCSISKGRVPTKLFLGNLVKGTFKDIMKFQACLLYSRTVSCLFPPGTVLGLQRIPKVLQKNF